jgi:hypothetical protein
MRHTELQKTDVIEPEVIIPGNDASFKRHTAAVGSAGNILGRFANAVFTVIAGAAMFIIFITVLIIIALPLLVLSLLGKKPNVKIFRYKI